MNSFSPGPRRRLSRRAILALPVAAWALGFGGLGLWEPALPAFGQQVPIQFPFAATPTPVDEDPYGVYLPTDRTLSRGMSRARERLADREYNEALAFLQQILDRDEDAFLDDASESNGRRGLKATARELIANLPANGRQMYDLLHATSAQRQLNAALATGDRGELAKLVRRYFHTPPGYEAALVLAQMEMDHGHPLAAAHLYEQLLADSATAAQFEPQLSMLTAVAWMAAGKPDQAAAKLRTLAKAFPDTRVELAGQKRRLPSAGQSDSELLAWLTDSIGEPQPFNAANQDWLTQRGDASRNSQHSGGAPHLSARWQARVVNDPRFETFLSTRREQAEQQGVVAISAARPIAAGNVVLMRTPQNLVAVDWQTGKRTWETREEESSVRDRFLADFMSGNDGEEWPAMSHPLEQRIWDDTLTMSLSSDGERVFALGGIALVQREDHLGWGNRPAFGGGQFDFSASPTNRLSAYELATEGKLAWEIDGADATGDLSGAFFLGPPLAVDGSLYVLAEIRSAVYLLALEPATGTLQWRQQLVGLEQGITLDPQRRLNGTTPSYAAGILVCPTTAGMVVAVDVIRREFAWVYRYPRHVESIVNMRQNWQGRIDGRFVRENRNWLDGSIVIAEGKVFLTPPESADVHCLELSTGKFVWKQPRDKSLFLAGADRGNVLLVGSNSVKAVRAADGSPAWSKERAELPAGVMPAGLGYLSEGQYYLPLTTGQVVAVRTDDGTVTGAVDSRSDVVVGNLICHRGAIISQSTLFLDKFEQIEVLRKRAETALAVNPRDATAIRDLAEIRRLDGDLPEAVRMLKQAFEIDAADPLTRDMLADCLLEALAQDYAGYRSDLPVLRQIVYRPQQQIELMRLDAQGQHASGQKMEAFDAYLRLADATAAEPLELSIGPEHTARSDRWIRSRLNALWNESSQGERDEISALLDERKRKWSDPRTINQLRTHLAYFGGLPGTEEVRLQLIQELLSRRELLDAEIELLKLERSTSPEYQAAAAILTTKLLLAEERLEEARDVANALAGNWPQAMTVDGKTPQQWLDEWRSELSAAEATVRGTWPRGRISVDILPAAPANRRNVTRRAQPDYQLGLRRLRVEQVYRKGLGASQWFIAQDNSRLVGRNASGKDVFRFNADRNAAMRRFAGNSDWVQAAQLGDLLYVTLGGQVLALDTRELGKDGEGDVVWQAYSAGRFPAVSLRSDRRATPTVYHSWSQRKRVTGPAGLLIGGLGPATPNGVVIQDQQQLRCVDPTSGETLWSRSDVPAGCELFGDEEFALVADVEESIVYVIDMFDGELVERRSLPATPWLLTSGRNVAQLIETNAEKGRKKTLRIVDAVSGRQIFSADYAPGVCMTTLEPDAVAVAEPPDNRQLAQFAATRESPETASAETPKGRFQLIDVGTGKSLIDQALPIASAPTSLYTLQSGNQLFLFVNGPSRQKSSVSIGPVDYPLIDGQAYAFDLGNGELMWPGPAIVEQRGITLTQPSDIPLLILVDRLVKRDSSGGSPKLRLMCLDKQSGATIYRNDELPDTPGSRFRIRTSRDETPAISVEMGSRTVRLSFSDQPRPPQPPANDFVEAPRKSLGRGLWGVGQRMGNVIQGVIQDPGANNWPMPAPARAGGAPEQEQPLDDD